jgi:hypothetical protein
MTAPRRTNVYTIHAGANQHGRAGCVDGDAAGQRSRRAGLCGGRHPQPPDAGDLWVVAVEARQCTTRRRLEHSGYLGAQIKITHMQRSVSGMGEGRERTMTAPSSAAWHEGQRETG